MLSALLRPGWLGRGEESLAECWVRLPLAAAALAYGAGAWIHRGLYRRGCLPRRRLPCRVVSVGNLVVGGAGKTPTAAWIAHALHGRGHAVALASRGYKRRARSPVEVVSDGRRILATGDRVGDEALLLAAHAPGVPVLVGADRGRVGLRAVASFGTEVLVLDDGFQHHRLARDVDLVVFDGRLGLGNRWTLPRGPLREPARVLACADALLVVDGPLPSSDTDRLRRLAPAAAWFHARRRPAGLRPLEGGALRPADDLRGVEVGLLAAIAHPRGFRATLEALGARVVAEKVFPDHHRYRPADLAGLAREAPRWVTTEKDAVKILPAWLRDAKLDVLVIELEPEEPEALLGWLERRLREPQP